jgi:PAS domain S-box-containing protein
MANDPAFLTGGGEMGALMRAKDWSRTPLGPVETWSQALRSAVGICLGSRFPIVLYWGPTRALLYNDAWSPVPGQKHPWALGRPGAEVWAEIWDIIGPMFDHVMTTGEATWSDDQLLPLHRFGYTEECYFYYSYSPVRGEAGQVEGIFTAVTETTYRVLAERRERLLREVSETTAQARTAEEACEAAVRTLAASPVEAPFCVAFLLDASGRGARRVAQARLEAHPELAPERLEPDADAPCAWPLAEVLASGAAVSVSGLASRLSPPLPGTPWHEPIEEALVTPIPSARAGAPHGVLVTGISPRRRLDAAYRSLFERAAGHLATAIGNVRAYESERQRAEQLAQIDRAKTAFFSNASHEFRTPLTLMLGPLEDMLATAPPGAGARTLQIERYGLELVHRNGLRLLKLVNTLLDFSRLEAGRVRAVFEPLDLAASTLELASTFRSAMERAGLAFHVDCPPLPEPVWVDRDMWEKIVLNLVSNAFKYTLRGEVAVRLRAVDGAAELAVRDTGVGIPPRELSRVFERFHRIEGQRGRTHEGTGIGLALVQELARLHHGSVRVESVEGQGSTFTVRLPFQTPETVPSPVVSPPVRAQPSARAALYVEEALGLLPGVSTAPASGARLPGAPAADGEARGGRIVLADDNADMRDYVRRLLADAGYEVHATADGTEALEAIRARRPELLLSDVMMPRLDGFGLLAALRQEPATADLPIILLSARAGEEASVEGLHAGADDYLVKPFSARELLARVEGVLRLARLRRETNDALRRANEGLEAQVAERTRELDRIWKVSQDHLLVADAHGVWLRVNPAWTRTLGWREDELVGRTSQWMGHPEDQLKTREEVDRLASGVTTLRFESRFRDTRGAWHWFSWKAVPDNGLLYCVARDVTEERQRQAALAQAQEALRQSQKMEAVGQLTGGIAHDFNNLLTGISGSLELLQLRVGRREFDKVDRYVTSAIASAQRAAALTHRLLAFSRRQSLDLKSVDMNALVLGMEDLLRRTLGERITLRMAPGEGLWRVHTDAHQLENTLLNLCINARDAMPQGGTLSVRTANVHLDPAFTRAHEGLAPGDYVVLSVTDTGTGIPPELRERIFEPFFTTKPIGQGTGLGLSMIYGFVKQSSGHLGLESELGQGTTFSVYLPRHRGEDTQAESTPGAAPRGRGETVLVVEDDPAVRMLVMEVLEELGYQGLEATEAQSARTFLESPRRIDLMVSDIGLPGLGGRQLADLARQHRPDLRILFITGYAQNAGVRGDFLGPGMDMLTKPFALDTLASKIRDMVASARQKA